MKAGSKMHKSNSESQLTLFPEEKKQVSLKAKSEDRLPKEFYQYFLLISPPKSIKQKVKGMKITLNKTIGLSRENLHSIAHISLLSFHSPVPMSEYSVSVLQQILSQHRSFKISVNGFDCFEHGNTSKTIYARIEDEGSISKIHEQLCGFFNISAKMIIPHMAIARTLENAVSDKGFRIIKQHHLQEQFPCDSITILERKLQNGLFSNYKVFHEIKLR